MNIANKIIENFYLHSEKIAISFEDNNITYKQLEEESKRICSYFICKGITGQQIGVCIKNPLHHVIAIIGVFLSGNSYLSITDDNSRFIKESNCLDLNYCLAQIDDDILISGMNIIFIEDIKDYYFDFTYPILSCEMENPMCVFITSGTIGIPKIVQHSYKNINEDILRQNDENKITQNDIFDLLFSMSFSASLACIFPALVSGAKLCIYVIKFSGISGVSEFWVKNRITVSNITVSTFIAIAKLHSTLKYLSNLRLFSLSAEKINNNAIELFLEKMPETCVLQIAYASTETRTISKIHLPNGIQLRNYNGTVGKAVRNKKIYIVGVDGEYLPSYIEGEIIVESEFIVDKYIGNTEYSNTVFKKVGKNVLYSTGDKGYLNELGELFISGRVNDDVKINGKKIDLSKIEDVLKDISFINQVCVVVNSTQNGYDAIVAFLTTNENITSNHINSLIAGKLSNDMYPNYYCLLDIMPVTHSGKIDRKYLQETNFNKLKSAGFSNSENIDNNLDKVIVEVFKNVTGVKNISSTDSFFLDLGGNSLSSLLVIAELEKKLQLKIPAYAVWTYPTAKELSKFIVTNNNNIVHHIIVGDYSSKKRNIFFINDFNGGNNYTHLINTEIANKYNIVHLFYNLEAGVKFYSAEDIVDVLIGVIKENYSDSDAIIIGYSFNGYVAQLMSAKSSLIKCCIMLDTPNYYDWGNYISPKSSMQKVRGVLKNIYQVKKINFLVNYLLKKINKNKIYDAGNPFNNGEDFLHAVREFLKSTDYKKYHTIHDCLFIKASYEYVFYPDHGYNWNKYINGNFKIEHLECSHSGMIKEKNGKLISKIILENIL